ncbi:TIGR03790 family protein [Ideonella sp. BN130291]|uniref:TIGR03790 family protein n=1 Tax=Ideonella sp. BN130291 TaxID=3112940 RepID=UPI002E263A76|nr:TIGR03790 family protein [Ideonella sp. BN130291]
MGRITAADIGLVINTADPYSEQVGAYYIDKRRLKENQVLRLALPVRATLTPEEFADLKRQIDDHFGPKVQALALAWTQPYAVQCNAITGALALGFDPELCRQTCGRSRPSPYFNAATSRPYTDKGLRLAMLLAASDVAQAKALVDRGVAADRSLGWRGAPPVTAYYLSTQDAARNVRARLYPPVGLMRRQGVQVQVEQGDALTEKDRLLLAETGLAKVDGLERLHWVDGALADHLTSFGGQLDRQGGQTTALAWIASGATASYGTVTEPCNHLQKFPHPQLLLLHYLQGSSAIEAYWKSVAWPQQGVFVGEPLAAPFAR